jgi:murein DD-endopeptidase MepM/ murein hydrolase activator NlpD
MLASQASYTGSIPVSRSIFMILYVMRFYLLGMELLLSSILITGCAAPRQPSVLVVPSKSQSDFTGIYHKVNKGETLWRIARTYMVSVDDIIAANRIPNAASIEENQLLLVPGANEVKVVDSLPVSGDSNMDYVWPLKGRVVAFFQDRRGSEVNSGVDIKGSEGDLVYASRAGRVVLADHLAGYGSTLIIDHADGFLTVYGHTARLLVSLGDRVFQGDKIAQVGINEKAYIHFELRKGSTPKNPLHYLPREM